MADEINAASEPIWRAGLSEAPFAVVTGANSGIGLAAGQALADQGWGLAIVARDQARLETAKRQLTAIAAEHARRRGGGRSAPIEAYRCDFSQLAQVRELGQRLRSSYEHIDVLANNAGGTFPGNKTTVDGYNLTIQVNHLAPFLLSHLLIDSLAAGRIINTASAAHSMGTLDPQLMRGRRPAPFMEEYGSAKQANILFTDEAARRWPEITSTAFHPGVVRTGFGRDHSMMARFYRFVPFLRTPQQGAQTLLWLATVDKAQLRSGGYYMDERLRRPSKAARDPHTAAQLWQASLRACGLA